MPASIFDPTTDLTADQLQDVVAEEISRRRAPVGSGPAAAGVGGLVGKTAMHKSLLDNLYGEFEEIRNDPERKARQMDQMERTYQNYLDQGNRPVDLFIPGKDQWAAWRDPDGNNVVWYDPSAPHPAVMAHELGHVAMFDGSDPYSQLQNSGIGRASGKLAIPIGIAAGGGGAVIGNKFGRGRAGAALGAALGALGGSGNFIYELGGASGRAMDYLPSDVDQSDAYGDLVRAGATYGMAPLGGLIAGMTAGGTMNALMAKERMAGQRIRAAIA